MGYNIYLFNSDESATILNKPVLRDVHPNTTEFDRDQLISIFVATSVGDDSLIANEMGTWSERKIIQAMFDINSIGMDMFAIVDDKLESDIEFKGVQLLETMHDDSSCYAAAEEFGELLYNMSYNTGSFPYPDFNIEHYSDIS